METTRQQIHLTILTPAQGMMLTQADENLPLLKRTVTAGPVYLAATDTPDSWREITVDEAQAITAAQQAEVERCDAIARQNAADDIPGDIPDDAPADETTPPAESEPT